MKNILKHLLKAKYILFVIVICFFSIMPLLHPGFLPTHDGEYHIIRFYEFNKVLRDGEIYPRWAPDLNYGVGIPLFNYVYPFPNYVASFFHVFNISFIDSFKLSMFFASIIGAVFFYLWARDFWGNLGGVVSSIFYTFSPYHFLDIYIRGSVGEVWALAFFPAFLWSITKLINERNKVFLIFSSVFLSLIILSHNILALMFVPFCVLYILFLFYLKKKFSFSVFVAFILGFGISAIFWLPALIERGYVVGLEVFDFRDHFPELYQLLIPSWGSGFSATSLENQISFQIGVANILAVIMSIFMVFKIRKRKESKIISFFIVIFFALLFLMLKISEPVWQIIPLMNYFQFPWRFLSLEILVSSFLAGSVIWSVKSKFSKFLSFVIIAIVFLLGIGYARPAYYYYRDDSYYLVRSNFIDGTNSPGNAFNTKWIKSGAIKREKDIITAKELRINLEKTSSVYYKFSIETEKSTRVDANLAYFPGWRVFVNGKDTRIKLTDNGLIYFEVPKGKSIVEIKLFPTNIQIFSMFISLISFIGIIYLSIKDHAIIKR